MVLTGSRYPSDRRRRRKVVLTPKISRGIFVVLAITSVVAPLLVVENRPQRKFNVRRKRGIR